MHAPQGAGMTVVATNKPGSRTPRHGMVGTSAGLRDALQKARRVAPTMISVLVYGETGTGKERLARYIHDLSGRGSFHAVNCSAIPESLLEAELFGYERGAFTGALTQKTGLFERADGGTLLLDEIGDMPVGMQAKLLRVLEEKEIVRLGSRGSSSPTRIDVRIIAATHCAIEAEAREGRFRSDLFYRLAGYRIQLPPLCERPGDAARLARHFVGEIAPMKYLSRDTRLILDSYPWPGNVRELRSVIQAASIDAGGRRIRADHLLPHLSEFATSNVATTDHRITQIVSYINGHGASTSTEIAAGVGTPRSTLHRDLLGLVDEETLDVIKNGGVMRYTLHQRDHTEHDLAPRLREGLRLVREEGRITRSEYANRLGVSPRTASRDLSTLVDEGYLASDGQIGKAAGYRPTDPAHRPDEPAEGCSEPR